MQKHTLLTATLCLGILFSSCNKDDEPKAEDPATAKVTYSAWFTPATYIKDTVFGIWGFRYDKDAPDITNSVLDSSVVLTFAKLSGYNPLVWPTGQVGQMPISLTYKQGTTQEDTWTASTTPGKLRVRFVNSVNTYSSIANTHSFRYIIIKGGIPAGRGGSMSYSDICRQYNIPE